MDWLLEKSSRWSYKTSSKKDREKTSYKEPASQYKIDHKKCTTTQSIRPQDKAPEKAQSTTSPICRLLLRTEGTIQHGLLPLQRDAMSPQKILLCGDAMCSRLPRVGHLDPAWEIGFKNQPHCHWSMIQPRGQVGDLTIFKGKGCTWIHVLNRSLAASNLDFTGWTMLQPP